MTKIKLTTDDVKHVAKLSRLDLTDEEIETYTKQLASIFEYVDKLKEIDTSEIKPTSQATNLEKVLRKDTVGKCLSQKEALSESKNKKNGYFKVKHSLGE